MTLQFNIMTAVDFIEVFRSFPQDSALKRDRQTDRQTCLFMHKLFMMTVVYFGNVLMSVFPVIVTPLDCQVDCEKVSNK